MTLGEIEIELIQKNIRHVHLSVLPPHGLVRIAAPLHLTKETIRLYAISKLAWIKKQQKKIRGQARESKREFTNKETHYFQGRKYLLRVIEEDKPAKVTLHKRHMDLHVRSAMITAQRQEVLDKWYREQLKVLVQDLIEQWERTIPVKVNDFGIKKMKTKWGTCNIEAGRIWINLELAKKPLECLEYIVVHEMVHLMERRHTDRFWAYMKKFIPSFKQYVEELNRLPVGHSDWKY